MIQKILLKTSEMVHGEVRSSETRTAALFEQERDAREVSCAQLRRDVEAMVTIVEALSAQVHALPTVPPTDPRLDVFLEQEKRARDSLREDVESLADQVSALEDERQKDGYANSLEEINALLEQERSNRDWTVTALRKELEEERKDRGLSMAVLRKDFKKELEALTVSLQEVSS